jgi:hypothetical protein
MLKPRISEEISPPRRSPLWGAPADELLKPPEGAAQAVRKRSRAVRRRIMRVTG